MQVTVDLPDDISQALEGQGVEVERPAREANAKEGFSAGALSESQVRRLLQFASRFEVHSFLKEHRVPLRYSASDLEEDIKAHRELGILPE